MLQKLLITLVLYVIQKFNQSMTMEDTCSQRGAVRITMGC